MFQVVSVSQKPGKSMVKVTNPYAVGRGKKYCFEWLSNIFVFKRQYSRYDTYTVNFDITN